MNSVILSILFILFLPPPPILQVVDLVLAGWTDHDVARVLHGRLAHPGLVQMHAFAEPLEIRVRTFLMDDLAVLVLDAVV